MKRFRRKTPEIPSGGVIPHIGLRIPFLGVDEIGEFERITDEKDRRIISDQVPISFFSIEFESEPADISFRIRRAPLTSHNRETQKSWDLLADSVKDGRF